jgi:tetratricopeptide (TPR) repeat protein
MTKNEKEYKLPKLVMIIIIWITAAGTFVGAVAGIMNDSLGIRSSIKRLLDNPIEKKEPMHALVHKDQVSPYWRPKITEHDQINAEIKLNRTRSEINAQEFYKKAIQAYNRFKYKDAATLFERATQLLDIPFFQHALGKCRLAMSEFPSARLHFQNALFSYRKIDDNLQVAMVLNSIGALEQQMGNWIESIKYHHEALDIGNQTNQSELIAESHTRLGLAHKTQGTIKDAEKHISQGLRLYQRMGDRVGESVCLLALGIIAQSKGQSEIAEGYYHEASGLEQKELSHLLRADIFGNLGITYQLQLRWNDANYSHTRALEIYRKIGNRYGEAHALNNIAIVLRQQNQFDEAIHTASHALKLYTDLNYKNGIAKTSANLGRMYLQKKKLQQARWYYKKSLEAAFTSSNLNLQAMNLSLIGIIDTLQKQYISALNYFESAIEINKQTKNNRANYDNLVNIGAVYYYRKDYGQALSYYNKGLVGHKALGNITGEADCLFNIGEALQEIGDYDASLNSYTEALRLYKSTGASFLSKKIKREIEKLKTKKHKPIEV